MKKLFYLLCTTPFFASVFTAQQGDATAAKQYFEAIRSNDLEAVRQLIAKSGTGVADDLGNRPLMYAALDGTPECFKLLILAGSDPNQANKDGATPLMWCANDPVKVGLLLQHGAK